VPRHGGKLTVGQKGWPSVSSCWTVERPGVYTDDGKLHDMRIISGRFQFINTPSPWCYWNILSPASHGRPWGLPSSVSSLPFRHHHRWGMKRLHKLQMHLVAPPSWTSKQPTPLAKRKCMLSSPGLGPGPDPSRVSGRLIPSDSIDQLWSSFHKPRSRLYNCISIAVWTSHVHGVPT
jgi:hypothetical protein